MFVLWNSNILVVISLHLGRNWQFVSSSDCKCHFCSGYKILSCNNTSGQLIRRFYVCFKQVLLGWFIPAVSEVRIQTMSCATKSWRRLKHGFGSISSLAHLFFFGFVGRSLVTLFSSLFSSWFFNSWFRPVQKARFYKVHSNSYFCGIPALLALIIVKFHEKKVVLQKIIGVFFKLSHWQDKACSCSVSSFAPCLASFASYMSSFKIPCFLLSLQTLVLASYCRFLRQLLSCILCSPSVLILIYEDDKMGNLGSFVCLHFWNEKEKRSKSKSLEFTTPIYKYINASPSDSTEGCFSVHCSLPGRLERLEELWCGLSCYFSLSDSRKSIIYIFSNYYSYIYIQSGETEAL